MDKPEMHRIEVWADFRNLSLSRTRVRTVGSSGHPFGGLFQVDLEVSWKSPGGLLEVNLELVELSWGLLEVSWKPPGNLNESLCWFAISMDEPEVRRVGFASFALLPPSRARAPLLLWGRESSGSGGGLCAMLEKPKFVPMARPYASDIPTYLFI